ncbi:uncharacterized protein BJ212DRAFT_1303728 [Suillus subaureus]|uniref:Uncharacterized protein n=1 Tax=Suillus subaureus TaxID=48587 RepID=A0A9P7J775_9AGAM|nr:uncharacterized protein BJ212DRAFT_1303728 [Suillus subaureus]KAG1806214.1 hypothetical protein BJ212DRAFT_1303728 [Suillus subaureus]
MCLYTYTTDIKECTRDYTYPQVEGTIEEFICNLDNPNMIQFILNLPYTGAGIPGHLWSILTISSSMDRGVTFVQPVLGKKMWIMAFPKNKILHTTFLEHSLQLTNLLEKCNKVKANQDMEVVTLLEGDLFFYANSLIFQGSSLFKL